MKKMFAVIVLSAAALAQDRPPNVARLREHQFVLAEIQFAAILILFVVGIVYVLIMISRERH